MWLAILLLYALPALALIVYFGVRTREHVRWDLTPEERSEDIKWFWILSFLSLIPVANLAIACVTLEAIAKKSERERSKQKENNSSNP